MTRFDFDVIGDTPSPRSIKPAEVPTAKTQPPDKEAASSQEARPVPRSDAA